MTPAQALVVVVGCSLVAFLAGVRFGKGEFATSLLMKFARWSDEMGSQQAAAERLVRWLVWYKLPGKWWDRPEEP